MPVIKRRDVRRARKAYVCDDCGRAIQKGTAYTYLYGSAFLEKKPYPLRFCVECQKEFDNLKERAA